MFTALLPQRFSTCRWRSVTARTCRDCDKRLTPRNRSGLCRTHYDLDEIVKGDVIKRRAATLRQRYRDDADFAKQQRARLAEANSSAGVREKRRQQRLKALAGSDPMATPAALAKRALAISNTRLRHIPVAYRAEYRHLTNNGGLSAAEATRIVLDQVDADEAHYRRTGEIRVGS